MIEWVLSKESEKVWTGFIWIKVGNELHKVLVISSLLYGFETWIFRAEEISSRDVIFVGWMVENM
jgi:hypothetical protein